MKLGFAAISGCCVREYEPLARHTSFRIGGPARYFVVVRSLRALVKVMEICRAHHIKVFILGAGTNILCSDKGYAGVTVRLKGRFSRVRPQGALFTCGSGVMVDSLLTAACSCGYGGAEFLAGIPGTVGGALYCNAGAFGHAIGEIVEQVTVMTARGKIRELRPQDIKFEYRYSGLSRGTIVVDTVLRFEKKSVRVIRRDLQTVKRYRHEHQPCGYSAGSFFKNPRPLAAGKLIDECGMKGVSVGDAVVSMQHANWIINRGTARARDVVKLVRFIKRRVKDRTGIELQEEVRRLR